MGGGVRHASSDARRTEPAALARERHNELLAALTAAQVHEPAVEQPTVEVRLELAHHEPRQPARLLGPLQKRGQMRAQHLVQHRLLGAPSRTAVGAARASGGVSVASNGNGGHRASSSDGAFGCLSPPSATGGRRAERGLRPRRQLQTPAWTRPGERVRARVVRQWRGVGRGSVRRRQHQRFGRLCDRLHHRRARLHVSDRRSAVRLRLR